MSHRALRSMNSLRHCPNSNRPWSPVPINAALTGRPDGGCLVAAVVPSATRAGVPTSALRKFLLPTVFCSGVRFMGSEMPRLEFVDGVSFDSRAPMRAENLWLIRRIFRHKEREHLMMIPAIPLG